WQNELERQKVSDQRYSDETAYAKGRDSLADARYKDETNYNRTQQALVNKRADAQLGLAQAQDSRAQKMHDLTLKKIDRENWEAENMPLIQSGFEKLQSGNPLSEAEVAAFSSEYGQRYNPGRAFSDPNFGRSIQTALGQLVSLSKNPDVPNMDLPTLHKTINTPETKQSMSYLLRDRLERGVGTPTPMGVVKGYGEPEIIPTNRGTFVIETPVTYIQGDGKTVTKNAPITEGRSGDDGAAVLELRPQQLAQWLGSGYSAYKGYKENPDAFDVFKQGIGLKNAPDMKGYQTQVVKAMTDTNKSIDRIRQDQSLEPEQQNVAIEAERKAYKQQVEGLASVYGIKQTSASGGAAEAPSKDFIEGDPAKAQFVAQLYQNKSKAEADALMRNPGDLSRVFNEWNKAQQGHVEEQKNTGVLESILRARL
ncbi:MAG: hypothetical protein ACRCXB_21920, partial [Aeromonadaceae bacterium]